VASSKKDLTLQWPEIWLQNELLVFILFLFAEISSEDKILEIYAILFQYKNKAMVWTPGHFSI
jgi:hypothetical protein